MKILSATILIYSILLDYLYSYEYEKEQLERLRVPITIDSAWLISKTMQSQSSNTANISLRRYMRALYVRTSQIFAWHNILYRVVHLEYLEKDPIQLSEDIHHDYYKIKKAMETYNMIPGQVDNTVFFRNAHTYSNVIGLASTGGVGTKETVAVIEAGDRTRWNVPYVALIVAHEIAHNLRVFHSVSLEPDCLCPMGRHNCLMFPYAPVDEDLHPFDRCSIRNITSVFKGKPIEAPIDLPSVINGCGNGIVEENEQCDCGFDRRVCEARNEHNCCDGKTCTLFDNATCSAGSCCLGCRVAQYGHICHEPEDECTYAQVCSGNSPQCDIIKKPDGLSCKRGLGRCYNGKCVTIDDLCENIPNNGMRLNYSRSCLKFHEYLTPTTDICSIKVYCTNVDHLSTDINSENQHLCIDAHPFTPWPFDGTPCSHDKMCHERKCKPVGDLNNCTAIRCLRDQICNRDGKCVPYDAERIRRIISR